MRDETVSAAIPKRILYTMVQQAELGLPVADLVGSAFAANTSSMS